jgi:hypothetical protein
MSQGRSAWIRLKPLLVPRRSIFAQWKAKARGNLGTVEFARAITSENITVVRNIANFITGRE